jgi:hypothetical protein
MCTQNIFMYKQNKRFQPKRKYGHFRGPRHGQFSGRQRRLPSYNPAMFVKKATETVSEEYVPTHSFADFQIHPTLKQNILSKGYKNPTPIQDMAIPALLEGKDVLVGQHEQAKPLPF